MGSESIVESLFSYVEASLDVPEFFSGVEVQVESEELEEEEVELDEEDAVNDTSGESATDNTF